MTKNQLSNLHQKIDQGVKKAITEAIEKHRQLGEAVAVYEDGQVITLNADQIPKT